MKLSLTLPILLFSTVSCSTVTPPTKPADELTSPGWFDVGAGVGMTSKGKNGLGYFVSVKAYPNGRWYAFDKSQKQETHEDAAEAREQAKQAQQAVADKKLALAQATDAKTQAAQAEQNALAAFAASQKQTANKAFANSIAAMSANNMSPADQQLRQDFLTKQAASQAAVQAEQQAQADLDQQQATADAADSKAMQATSDALVAALDATNQSVYRVDGASGWQRFSISLSTSVLGGFTRDGADLSSDEVGDLWAVGISYDVAPQFALHAGYGILAIDGAEDDETAFFGVSLNTNAFRALFGEVGDGSDT